MENSNVKTLLSLALIAETNHTLDEGYENLYNTYCLSTELLNSKQKYRGHIVGEVSNTVSDYLLGKLKSYNLDTACDLGLDEFVQLLAEAIDSRCSDLVFKFAIHEFGLPKIIEIKLKHGCSEPARLSTYAQPDDVEFKEVHDKVSFLALSVPSRSDIEAAKAIAAQETIEKFNSAKVKFEDYLRRTMFNSEFPFKNLTTLTPFIVNNMFITSMVLTDNAKSKITEDESTVAERLGISKDWVSTGTDGCMRTRAMLKAPEDHAKVLKFIDSGMVCINNHDNGYKTLSVKDIMYAVVNIETFLRTFDK